MANLYGGGDNDIVQPLTKIGEFRCSSKRQDTSSGCKKNLGGKLWVSSVC